MKIRKYFLQKGMSKAQASRFVPLSKCFARPVNFCQIRIRANNLCRFLWVSFTRQKLFSGRTYLKKKHQNALLNTFAGDVSKRPYPTCYFFL